MYVAWTLKRLPTERAPTIKSAKRLSKSQILDLGINESVPLNCWGSTCIYRVINYVCPCYGLDHCLDSGSLFGSKVFVGTRGLVCNILSLVLNVLCLIFLK